MDESIKVVFLGQSSVGKSSLLLRLSEDTFHEHQQPTIGAAFVACIVDGVNFSVWDTAGQERYRSMAPLYYRNAHAAIIVFDATQRDSFLDAKEWVTDVDAHTQDVLIIICANKMDKYREQKEQAARRRAESGRAHSSLSVSAKIKSPRARGGGGGDRERGREGEAGGSGGGGSDRTSRSQSSAGEYLDGSGGGEGEEGATDGDNLLKEALKYCIDQGFEFVQASAKTGENVREMFELIADKAREAMARADSAAAAAAADALRGGSSVLSDRNVRKIRRREKDSGDKCKCNLL